jgi:4-amino-4-deoxy-L-arabinose transferase-like glycosyltransferase
LYVLLVWLAYGLAKELVPASKFVYLGVPLVLAFLPQDIFYGLNNDVLSAPLATLSLYLLVRLYRSGEEKRGQSPTKLCLVPAGTARRVLRTNGDCPLFPSWGLALGAGLAVAAAMLTKFTNAPLLVIAAAVALLKAGLPWWRERSRTQLLPMALLLLVSLVPVGCWMARNYVVLGDPTGFSLRSRFMGWTPNPLGQYLHHPIFTPGGLLFFCHSLATTLWRGELLWHRSMLTIAPVDTLYFVSSMLLPLCFVMASFPGGEGAAARRQTAMLCLASVVLSVGLLVLFSISYDFGTGPFNYPSRAFPYFTQGRLILAALVPFLIVYLSGLESFLEWLRLGFLRLPLLIILADVMVISEIVYSLDVFVSQYNWFHLP